MNSPLFRPEILQAQSSQWMGAIRLAQPISTWMIVTVATAITTSVIALSVTGTYARRVHVAGVTVASSGSVTLAAPDAGILLRNLVEEGQEVKAGQPLFELSFERRAASGEITALIAQQIAVRAQSIEAERRTRAIEGAEHARALDSQLQNVAHERTQLEQELALARRRVDLSKESVAKYQILQKGGFVAASLVQQKQEDLIDIETRLSTLSRSLLDNEAKHLSIQADRDSARRDLALAMAQLDRANASLVQERVENQNRRSMFIVAPRDGRITTITYQPGQAVNAGQVLATLLSSDSETTRAAPLAVHLYAASRTAGFVARGQQVLLRYHAYPYQKFGMYKGVVTDVSTTPFAPGELPASLASTILSSAQQSGGNANEGLYRIKVRLESQTVDAYGKPQPLKPGMTLDADLLQDDRRIWEWFADPLLAFVHK